MPNALRYVCDHFQRYPGVGALTGELKVQRPYRTYLTAVQFCEWKVSHLLQKPVESVCGFLTVLPGAFCAFRWTAVEVRARRRRSSARPPQPPPAPRPTRARTCTHALTRHSPSPAPLAQGEPLRKYFYGLYSQAELNAFEANMFLAEDRILCLEVSSSGHRARGVRGDGARVLGLRADDRPRSTTPPPPPPKTPPLPQIVAKKGAAFRLEYIKEAVAEADPGERARTCMHAGWPAGQPPAPPAPCPPLTCPLNPLPPRPCRPPLPRVRAQ